MVNDDQRPDYAAAITAADASSWIAKAQPLVRPLLELPGAPAAPAPVLAVAAHAVADGPLGGFMLTWPEAQPDWQEIHYLPNGQFFLRLLERVYEPILTDRPHLRSLLGNRSRLEMAVTNDVLQVQLVAGANTFSMIRHHALMLFEATLWLEPTSRSRWLELYDAAADLVMADRTVTPSLRELAEIEAAGYSVMRRCALRSIDDSTELLSDPVLDSVATYQLWAAAAVGALSRDYASRGGASEAMWHAGQLAQYQQADYLRDRLDTWL